MTLDEATKRLCYLKAECGIDSIDAEAIEFILKKIDNFEVYKNKCEHDINHANNTIEILNAKIKTLFDVIKLYVP